MSGCQCHKDAVHPSLTEEMIARADFLPDAMKGWRAYRIEYGFECSCPEGMIYLPPYINPIEIERILNLKEERKEDEDVQTSC